MVDDQLFLGEYSDPDVDGLPSAGADGDDNNLQVSVQGTLFNVSIIDGNAEIEIQDTVDALTRDGDTITIDTGVSRATLEFDVDGLFDEDNYAIRPVDPGSPESIAAAIGAAIDESPLRRCRFPNRWSDSHGHR